MKLANFDRIARPYRWLEYLTLGGSLERCRKRFLPATLECRSALVLGDGDGRFTAGLLAANSDLYVDAVDTSSEMLRLLESRVRRGGALDRMRTYRQDARSFVPQRRYDLIATHFFLDCLTQREVDALCLRLAQHLRSDGLWLVSEFHVTAGWLHWPARALVRSLYLAFRTLTGLRVTRLPDHRAALGSAGLQCDARVAGLGGLLISELWRPAYTAAMLSQKSAPKVADPVPNPEPASPSLAEPDPGVFHHEPGTLPSRLPPANPEAGTS